MHTAHEAIEFIKGLQVEERIQIVEEVWDSVAKDRGFPALTQAQEAELQRRLEAYPVTEERGKDWETLREELMSRYRAG